MKKRLRGWVILCRDYTGGYLFVGGVREQFTVNNQKPRTEWRDLTHEIAKSMIFKTKRDAETFAFKIAVDNPHRIGQIIVEKVV